MNSNSQTSISECMKILLGDDVEACLASCTNCKEQFSLLRKAYLKLCLTTHPDKGGDPARFREVNNDTMVLTNAPVYARILCFKLWDRFISAFTASAKYIGLAFSAKI